MPALTISLPRWLTLALLCLSSASAFAAVADKTYFSKANNRAITIKVYTPPGYETSQARYPVVYNLHGGGSPARQWERVGATLVNALEKRGVRPMIYVFADGLGDTLFVDTAGTKKQAETTVIKELITFIDANYRTIAAREGRAIDGFSMGGFGALMFALRNPELFSSAVSYGAAVVTFDVMSAGIKKDAFGDNAAHFTKFDPRQWLARNAAAIRKGVRVRMVCGTKDDLYPANVDFKTLLEQKKIPVSW